MQTCPWAVPHLLTLTRAAACQISTLCTLVALAASGLLCARRAAGRTSRRFSCGGAGGTVGSKTAPTMGTAGAQLGLAFSFLQPTQHYTIRKFSSVLNNCDGNRAFGAEHGLWRKGNRHVGSSESCWGHVGGMWARHQAK